MVRLSAWSCTLTTHTHTHVCLLIHSPSHSRTRSLAHSLTHSLTHSHPCDQLLRCARLSECIPFVSANCLFICAGVRRASPGVCVCMCVCVFALRQGSCLYACAASVSSSSLCMSLCVCKHARLLGHLDTHVCAYVGKTCATAKRRGPGAYTSLGWVISHREWVRTRV